MRKSPRAATVCASGALPTGAVLHRKFPLDDDENAARRAVPRHQQGADHFRSRSATRATNSAISISVIDWGVVWGEQHKAGCDGRGSCRHTSTATVTDCGIRSTKSN